MSAGLFGEIYSTEPVWHNFAHVMPGHHTSVEAAQVANVCFPIEKAPTMVMSSFGNLSTGKFDLVRGPVIGVDESPKVIAHAVSEDYHVMQNADYVDLLQPLSEKYGIETMGALKDGQVFFASIDAGEWQVKDELVKQYFVIQDTRDGKTGFWMRGTPVRPVCMNTLAYGAAVASIAINLNHSTYMVEGVQYGVEVFSQMIEKARTEGGTALELLASVKLDADDVKRCLESIYKVAKSRKPVATSEALGPEAQSLTEELFGFVLDKSKKDQEYAAGLVTKQREWALQAWEYQNTNETEAVRGTAYGLLNAVAYVEQYRPGKEARDVEVVLGNRRATIAKAFEVAYAIASERAGETHKTQY